MLRFINCLLGMGGAAVAVMGFYMGVGLLTVCGGFFSITALYIALFDE